MNQTNQYTWANSKNYFRHSRLQDAVVCDTPTRWTSLMISQRYGGMTLSENQFFCFSQISFKKYTFCQASSFIFFLFLAGLSANSAFDWKLNITFVIIRFAHLLRMNHAAWYWLVTYFKFNKLFNYRFIIHGYRKSRSNGFLFFATWRVTMTTNQRVPMTTNQRQRNSDTSLYGVM